METDAELHEYTEIAIGELRSFRRTISREDVVVFSKLTGDMNPLHTNEEFGRNSKFGKNIVHGMLVASLFSTLVGMYCPGEKSLYLSQTAQFKSPLFYGDTVEVRGTVIDKSDAVRIVTMRMEILRGADIIVLGEAKVQVTA